MEKQMERPDFDYVNMPHLPREGVQAAGNNKFRTKSLFLETCPADKIADVMWCLSEHEVYCNRTNRWLPSACMVYINAADEYDALRKIVGSVRHWEVLKGWTLPNQNKFIDILEGWRIEQAYIQTSAIKATLLEIATSKGDVSASRTLLQLINGKPPGRPRKPVRGKESAPKTTRIDDDWERLSNIA